MAPHKAKAAQVGQHRHGDAGVFFYTSVSPSWVIKCRGELCSPLPLKLRPVLQGGCTSLSPTPEQAETCTSPWPCRQVVAGVSLVRYLVCQPCSACAEPWGPQPSSAVLNTGGQHFWESPLEHHWLHAMT